MQINCLESEVVDGIMLTSNSFRDDLGGFGLFRPHDDRALVVKFVVGKDCQITRNIPHSYVGYLVSETMITITSVEAQNHLGQSLDTVQRETVAITRHGRATAFIVSAQDMAELLNAWGRRGKAAADLKEWSAQAQKRATPAAAILTDENVNWLVHDARTSAI